MKDRRWYDDPQSPEFKAHVAKDPWRLHVIDRLDQLKKALLWRYIALVTALLIVGGWVYFTSDRVSHNQRLNSKALCTFRRDVQERVDATEEFLRKHPHGIPGVPISAFRLSLSNERATVTALAVLDCRPQ